MVIPGAFADQVIEISCPILQKTLERTLSSELLSTHPISNLVSNRSLVAELNSLTLKRYNSLDRSVEFDPFEPKTKQYYDLINNVTRLKQANLDLEKNKLTEADKQQLLNYESKESTLLSKEEFKARSELLHKKKNYASTQKLITKLTPTKKDTLFVASYKKTNAKFFAEEKVFNSYTTTIDEKISAALKLPPPKKSVDYYSNYDFDGNTFEVETREKLSVKSKFRRDFVEGTDFYAQLVHTIKGSKLETQLPKGEVQKISFNVFLDGKVSAMKMQIQIIIQTSEGESFLPLMPVQQLITEQLLPASCPVPEETSKAAINDSREKKDIAKRVFSPARALGAKAKVQ